MKLPTLARLYTMVLALVLLTFSGAGYSAGGNYSSDFDFEPVMELIAEEQYQLAIDMLHDELDNDPDNPDIMSLLGYRTTKML